MVNQDRWWRIHVSVLPVLTVTLHTLLTGRQTQLRWAPHLYGLIIILVANIGWAMFFQAKAIPADVYSPFRLLRRQLLYHQAPLCWRAQLPSTESLSLSLVLNCIPTWYVSWSPNERQSTINTSLFRVLRVHTHRQYRPILALLLAMRQ